MSYGDLIRLEAGRQFALRMGYDPDTLTNKLLLELGGLALAYSCTQEKKP